MDWVPIDPERLKRVYDDLVSEAGASVLFHTHLSRVGAEDGNVEALVVTNKAGLTALKAKVYVDCTGDAEAAEPNVHEASVSRLRSRLREEGAYLPEDESTEPVKSPPRVELASCRGQARRRSSQMRLFSGLAGRWHGWLTTDLPWHLRKQPVMPLQASFS